MKSSGYKFKEGFIDGIPIGLGYLSVSFAFGIAAAGNNIPFWAAVAISMTNLTSAGQFAGLSVIAALGSYTEMILTQLVINMRYALMSLSLSQKIEKGTGFFKRSLIAFFNTDEIFFTASSKEGKIGLKYILGLGTAPYIGWSLGTALGAAAGNVLPSSLQSALGIAIYGMFIAIVMPPAKKNKNVALVLGFAVILSTIIKFVPIFSNLSDGFSVIICAIIAAAVGALLFPCEREAKKV